MPATVFACIARSGRFQAWQELSGATEVEPATATSAELRPRDFSARMRRRDAGPIGRERRQHRRLLAFRLLIAILAVAGISCWSNPQVLGIVDGSPAEAATLTPGSGQAIEPMPFEKPGESFPGGAYYYLARDDVPSPGTPPRGDVTAAPNRDGAADLRPSDAARPVAPAVSPLDRSRSLTCLTAAIYYEAATEPDAGQRAVAQVVLNRMAHPGFPKTVCGVVYQGSERASGCQFTFSCDGSLARPPAPFFWRRAEAVARAALAGFVFTPIGLATHYHTFAVHPAWSDSLDFIGQIGAHRFYRMTGPAGAARAFSFAYGGGEPLPFAHLRSGVPSEHDASPDPLALERAYDADLRAARGNVQQVGVIMAKAATAPAPDYSSDALRRGGDAAFRMREPDAASGIKPEYLNSGRWITAPQ